MSLEQYPLTRRAFLRTTGCGAAAALAANVAVAAPARAKPLLPHGLLGKTKHPATLVSFGGILLGDKTGTRVLRAGIDAGINLLHTSASYMKGRSVQAIGELFKAAPEYREKVFLCLKSFHPQRESELTDMLKGLGTDRADLLLSTMDDPNPARLEEIQKAQDKLKKSGLIRHTGFVCHGDMSGVIEMVLQRAPDYFDATLLSTAPLNGPSEPKERFVRNLAGLRKRRVGIISMKSGSRKAIKEGAAVYGPHVKEVLAAGADTVLTSIDTFDQVGIVKDLPLKSPASMPEKQAAADFRRSHAGSCLMCGECAKACPRRVPVNDVMRLRMYQQEYGWLDHARSELAFLESRLASCTGDCGSCRRCAEVCPVGLASADCIRETLAALA